MQNSKIIDTFHRMELLKLDGLDTPIRVETYAFYAATADALLHKKLFEEGRLSSRDIALIAKARQEYRRSQRLLSTYSTGIPTNELQNTVEKNNRRQIVQDAISLRESSRFNLYEQTAQAVK
jgi:hypothetical protein